MAFDDLAKHMAARDKKKLGKAGSADQLVAEAAASDRRMSRQRDLILGVLLVVIGIVGCVLGIMLAEAKPSARDLAAMEDRGFRQARTYAYVLAVAGLGALAAGARTTIRALRDRSHLATAGEADPMSWLPGRR